MTPTLTAISRYPIKSCRGESLRSAVVEPWGLAGDRRWMLVDLSGTTVTAREHPRLVLIRPRLTSDGLDLTSPDGPDLSVGTPDGTRLTDVNVWREPFPAALATNGAHRWFSTLLDTPVRLVYLDDPTRRPTDPRFSADTDRVSFADGYPIHVTTEESLAAVNEWVADGPLAAEGPLPMTRFRPNLVLRGAPAWAEDSWRRIYVGAAAFRVATSCDRCAVTLVDPADASTGKEPIATLARHRKWAGKTWFGRHLIPDCAGVVLRVGDQIRVAESDG